MEARGSGFLKVVGILMIITGGIALPTGFFMFGMVDATNILLHAAGVNYNMGAFYAGTIITIIAAALQIATGIIGCIFAKRPERANICLILGCIVAGLCVVGTIVSASSGFATAATITSSLVLGLILPGLFILGSILNKKSA